MHIFITPKCSYISANMTNERIKNFRNSFEANINSLLTFGALYFNELSDIAIQDSFFNTMNKLKTIISPSFMNDL